MLDNDDNFILRQSYFQFYVEIFGVRIVYGVVGHVFDGLLVQDLILNEDIDVNRQH